MQRLISRSVRSSPQYSCLGWFLAVETDFSFLDGVLLEWHAQCLGRPCQWVFSIEESFFSLNSWSFLDLLFAVLVLAPWCQNNVLLVQFSHELFPVDSCLLLIVQSVYSVLIHVSLNLFQKFSQWLDKIVLRKLKFFTIVSENTSDFILFNVFWTQLNSNWDALEFPVVVLPAWVVIVSVVVVNSDIRLF